MSANFNDRVCGTVGINNTSKTAESKWTAKMVEEYFLEVISTLKKLPPIRQRGYVNLWPGIIHTPNELLFQEKKPMRILATPEAIARVDKTFDWLIWLDVEERKLIWRRASNVRWRSICNEFGYNRITAWRKYNFALEKIVKYLNKR